MHTFYNVKIRNINKETAHAVSIVFDIPESIRPHFIFKAGQYITLKSHINNLLISKIWESIRKPERMIVTAVTNSSAKGQASIETSIVNPI